MVIWLLIVFVPVASDREEKFTAGNTQCRHDNICGYHQNTKYSWCYTDYSDRWGYCCTSLCLFAGREYQRCYSGNTWQYCGNYRTYTITGKPCLLNHPCGMHYEEGEINFVWCYIDLNQNYEYCCREFSACSEHGEKYTWCYISGFRTHTEWDYCKKVVS
ncbi:hypothetical protein ACJMK2_021524 [Sinanodonta woodiana]|uniref:Uncharacterized protein n=1 Tax=Sinanodonta woodiana TaxID=1069815 RepID=A0ABD3THI1_SINWO